MKCTEKFIVNEKVYFRYGPLSTKEVVKKLC